LGSFLATGGTGRAALDADMEIPGMKTGLEVSTAAALVII